ncbi:MAG TPA: helix-turn-helix domain-containing protein [Verrucomicrobiae bacterium]|nr:helix-turn-helix domain-containing protein [Verrucomicrobiae bacterium]
MNDAIKTIRQEFRRSKEARYIHRLHGVLLVLLGRSTVEAARFLGVPQRTLAHWAKEFSKGGLSGLTEKEISGRPPVLKRIQYRALQIAIEKAPDGAGLSGDRWTGALVSEFLRKRYGLKMTVRHCRRLLRSVEQRL